MIRRPVNPKAPEIEPAHSRSLSAKTLFHCLRIGLRAAQQFASPLMSLSLIAAAVFGAGIKVFGINVDPALFSFLLVGGIWGLLNFLEYKRFD